MFSKSIQATSNRLEQDITEIIERDEAEAAKEIIPSIEDDNCSRVNIHQGLEKSCQPVLPQSMAEAFLSNSESIMSSTPTDLMSSSSGHTDMVCVGFSIGFKPEFCIEITGLSNILDIYVFF